MCVVCSHWYSFVQKHNIKVNEIVQATNRKQEGAHVIDALSIAVSFTVCYKYARIHQVKTTCCIIV